VVQGLVIQNYHFSSDFQSGTRSCHSELSFFVGLPKWYNPMRGMPHKRKLKVTSRMFGTYVWQRSTSQYIAYCPEVLKLLICPPLEVHGAHLLTLPFSCMHKPNSMLDIWVFVHWEEGYTTFHPSIGGLHCCSQTSEWQVMFSYWFEVIHYWKYNQHSHAATISINQWPVISYLVHS
jgi:hypothetical protein